MKYITRVLKPTDMANFINVLLANNHYIHHLATRPAYVSKVGYYGYFESYKGRFGDGWRIVIHEHSQKYYGNDLVIYMIQSEQSNQLDRKEDENG